LAIVNTTGVGIYLLLGGGAGGSGRWGTRFQAADQAESSSSTVQQKGSRKDYFGENFKERGTTQDERLGIITLRDHSKPQVSWTAIGKEVSFYLRLRPVRPRFMLSRYWQVGITRNMYMRIYR
jgi:hypothetical protein